VTISSSQRRYLKGLGHSLEPIVRIGRAGVTEGVTREAARTLEAHELIKIKVEAETSEDRDALAASLADATSSQLVSTIGRTAILYRRHPDKPKIVLPE
jgi:RNA-binding protein